MADNCEFGNMRSEMIWDRLIIGRHNQQLSKWLQVEPELTLAKAEKLTRQRAAIGQQQQKLKVPAETKLQLESMSRGPRIPHPHRKPTQQRDKNRSDQQAKANRCGKDSHPIQKCPARDAQCQKCKRKGHYTTKY